MESNSTRSVSYHYFGWAFANSGKFRVDEGRPFAFKTRFFDFPHRGEANKHLWDRIPRGRFHSTILGWLFQAVQKAWFTKVAQFWSKRVFSTFPIGSKRIDTLGIEFHEVGFILPFWVGFSKQRKKPGWRRSSNFIKTRFFDFPHRGKANKQPWDRILRGLFHTTILSGLFQAAQKAGLTKVVQLRSKRVYGLFPSGRREWTPLGSNSTTLVSYHHFGLAFPSSAKSRVEEGRPIAVKTRFFDFPHRGEATEHHEGTQKA